MSRTLRFRAYGTPRPQGSKRYVGNGRFVEASNVKPWRKAIADAVFSEFVRSGECEFSEPIVVRATFFILKPKTVKRLWPAVPPDTDKLCRALGDALSVDSKVVTDDSLIVRWEAAKVYVTDPAEAGVVCVIRAADDSDLFKAMTV